MHAEGDRLGLWGAMAIGIGGMVGGGIFAVLGLAVQLSKGGTPVAFAVAGTVALLTAYSYAKLSVHFPSRGGTVVFLDRAFGVDLVTGTFNSLLWLSYMVMVALYAFAFGSYGATFFSPVVRPLASRVLMALGILLPTAVNTLNPRLIGRAETYVVGLKLLILGVFVAVGLTAVKTSALAPRTWAAPGSLLAGGMIIFVAYEGFELIANAAEDMKRPARTLPRAFYGSVGFVVVLYVLIAAVAVGSLPLDAIVKAKDYALAAAAQPVLGHAGFVMIAVAALLSTLSAINATLYGAARLSYAIAKEGELPHFLERTRHNAPVDGLVITSGLALALAMFADLESISTMGSAGFLIVFGAVNAANMRLHHETKSRVWISLLGLLACAGALAALLVHTAHTAPGQLWVLAAMIGLAFIVEASYRFVGRALQLRGHSRTPHA